MMKRRFFFIILFGVTALFVSAQGPKDFSRRVRRDIGPLVSGSSTTYAFKSAVNGLWQYNSSANVYYIVGLIYCSAPADASYEQMGLFVPAKYMNATANANGTYTCTLNSTATVNGYTAATAPIVVPVNTPAIRLNRLLRDTPLRCLPIPPRAIFTCGPDAGEEMPALRWG